MLKNLIAFLCMTVAVEAAPIAPADHAPQLPQKLPPASSAITPTAPSQSVAAAPVVTERHVRRGRIAVARRSYSLESTKGSYASEYFDFRYSGDVSGALAMLRDLQPNISMIREGEPAPIDVDVDLSRVTAADVIASLGNAVGDKAILSYDAGRHLLRLAFFAPKVRELRKPVDDVQAEARRWQAGEGAKPVRGNAGQVLFPYGEAQPTVTCAPLRACDVELEPGEVIDNVVLGDTVRWLLAPAKSGVGGTAIQHIILKPTETNLSTDMIVTTNKRTYMFTLKSDTSQYVSRIGFYYPDDMVTKWDGEAQLAQRRTFEEAQKVVTNMPALNLDNLNLDGYKVEGDKALKWYPERVFDDGAHVYLQMSDELKSADAPSLVLVDDSGKTELVNYRVKTGHIAGRTATYYIVDKLFKRAALIVGVPNDGGWFGWLPDVFGNGGQQKIEIVREAR